MIETVKIQGDGYLVNGTMSVPKADGNKDYEEVKQWLSEGNAPEPEFAETELLEIAKIEKLRQIENDFILAEEQTVSYLGFDFIGGAESVSAIDGYVRLNRLAGVTAHSIWDSIGVEHNLTDSEADELILAIGNQASINKFTKKNRKVALATATTITEIESI